MSRGQPTDRDETVALMHQLIDAHLRHLRAAGMAANTVNKREELLQRVEEALPMGLARATTEEIESFLAEGRCLNGRPWSNQTKATYHGHLVGFFRWATSGRDPYLDYDPSAGLIRPRVPKAIPNPVKDAELHCALGELPEPWRLYAAIAAYSGARCCELAVLRREDVSQQAMRIVGKGGKTRIVPTHPIVWQMVEPLPEGPIARRRDGRPGPVTPGSISTGMLVNLERIGLRRTSKVSAHRFRHWLGTTALRPREFGGGGASLRTVQELLGHESPATTAGYTLVTNEERDAAIAALPSYRPTSS